MRDTYREENGVIYIDDESDDEGEGHAAVNGGELEVVDLITVSDAVEAEMVSFVTHCSSRIFAGTRSSTTTAEAASGPACTTGRAARWPLLWAGWWPQQPQLGGEGPTRWPWRAGNIVHGIS